MIKIYHTFYALCLLPFFVAIVDQYFLPYYYRYQISILRCFYANQIELVSKILVKYWNQNEIDFRVLRTDIGIGYSMLGIPFLIRY